MKNNLDFNYEYSDLNLFKTRVAILTGEYADIILEFGGSILAQNVNQNTFTFEYQLFQIPQHLKGIALKGTKDFEMFLGYLLVDIIDSRNNDPEEKNKLKQAASSKGALPNTIKINPWFYNKQATVI